MKYFILKISILFFASALLLSSCGPYLEFFSIDVKVPANKPVDFKDKAISVFSAVPLNEQNGENLITPFQDSVLMTNFAKGMAISLENNLSLDAGTIPVFKHSDGEISDIRDRSFIEILAKNSESDILVLLENLNVGKFEKLKVAQSPLRAGYAMSYIYAPLSLLVNVYDGYSGDLISSHDQRDTIYWEILSKEDVRDERLFKGLFPALNKISIPAGEDIVNNFFPKWKSEERCLFTYENFEWKNAYSLAMDFKWQEAMAIWLKYTPSENNVQASCAAFNVAVACEMLEKYDLATEWLDYANKRHPIKGLGDYKSFMKK